MLTKTLQQKVSKTYNSAVVSKIHYEKNCIVLFQGKFGL